MNRRSFIRRSFLGLCAAAILPKIPIQNNDIVESITYYGESKIWISKEMSEAIKQWNVYQIDEQTRREIYENTELGISNCINSVSFIVTKS